MDKVDTIKYLQSLGVFSDINNIKEEIGHVFEVFPVTQPGLRAPDISVHEKIKAICEYLKIEIIKEPEKIVVKDRGKKAKVEG